MDYKLNVGLDFIPRHEEPKPQILVLILSSHRLVKQGLKKIKIIIVLIEIYMYTGW